MKKSQFASAIGLQHAASLSRIFRSSTVQCEMLEKICRALDVHPSYFFDDGTSGATAQASTVIGNASASAVSQSEDIAVLRELLAEKERTIQILLGRIGTKTGQDD